MPIIVAHNRIGVFMKIFSYVICLCLLALNAAGASFNFNDTFQDDGGYNLDWGMGEPEPPQRPAQAPRAQAPMELDGPEQNTTAAQNGSPKQNILHELRLDAEEKYVYFKKIFQKYLNLPPKSWRMTPAEIMEKIIEISRWISPLEEELRTNWLEPVISREKAIEGLEKSILFLNKKLDILGNLNKKGATKSLISHLEMLIREFKKDPTTSHDYVYEVQNKLKYVTPRIRSLFEDFLAEEYFPSALLHNRNDTAVKVNEATGVVSRFFAQNNLEVPRTPEYESLRIAIEQFYEKMIGNLLGGIRFLNSLKDERSLDMARQNKLIIAEIAMVRNDNELAFAMCEDICLQKKSTAVQKITAAFYFAKMGVAYVNPFTQEKYDYQWVLAQKETPQWIRNKSLIGLGVLPKQSSYTNHWITKGPLTHEIDIPAFNRIQGLIEEEVVRQKETQGKRISYLSSLEIRPASIDPQVLMLEGGAKMSALDASSNTSFLQKEQALSRRVMSELPLSRSERPQGYSERALTLTEVKALALTRPLTREEAENAIMLESTVDKRQAQRNREEEADYRQFYGRSIKYADLNVDESRKENEAYTDGMFIDPCVGAKTTRENIQAEEDYVGKEAQKAQAAMADFHRMTGGLYGLQDLDMQDALKADRSTQIQRHPEEFKSASSDQRLVEILFSFPPDDENFAEPKRIIEKMPDFLKNLENYKALKNGEGDVKFFLLGPNQKNEDSKVANFEEQLKKIITDIYYLPKVPKDAFFALAQRYPNEFNSVSFASFFKYSATIKKNLYNTLEAKYKNLRQTLPDLRPKISHKIAQLIKENISIENRLLWLHKHYQQILQELGPLEKCSSEQKALGLRVYFEMAKLSVISTDIDWAKLNPKVIDKLELFNDRFIRKAFADTAKNPSASPKLRLKAKFALYEFDRKRSLHPTEINFIENPELALRAELSDYAQERKRSTRLLSRLARIEKYEKMLADDCPPSLVPEVMLALAELYVEEASNSNDSIVYFKKAFKVYQMVLTNALPRLTDKLKARVGLAQLERLHPAFKEYKNVQKSAEPRLVRTDKVLDLYIREIEAYLKKQSDQIDDIISGTGINLYVEMPNIRSTEISNMNGDYESLEDLLDSADFCSYRINEIKLWIAKVNYFGLPGINKNHYRSFNLLKQIISDRSVSAALKSSAELFLARLYLFSLHKDFALADVYLSSVLNNNDALKEDKDLAQKYLAKMKDRGCLKRKAENQDNSENTKRLKLNT